MGKKAFRNSLLKHKVFALDTCCFIYHFQKHPRFSLFTREIFYALKKKKALVSSLVLAELLSKKAIFLNEKKRFLYKAAFLSIPNTKIIGVDLLVAEAAAGLRVTYNLRLPDAIHLGTAIVGKANVFITNDARFKKIKEIDTIVLKDYL